jgi:hypothetical protein
MFRMFRPRDELRARERVLRPFVERLVRLVAMEHWGRK